MKNSSMDQNEKQKQATTQSSCQMNVELVNVISQKCYQNVSNVKNVFQ